jgi:hypothetical protein
MLYYYRPYPYPALMPMPYYIFPNAFSEPKAEEETRRLRLASLLHPRGLRHCPVRPRPSAEAQWLHLRHRDPSVLTSVLVSEPKARRGDATSAPASLLHIRSIRSLLHLRGLRHCHVRPRPRPSSFISSQTHRPLCPERKWLPALP